ncbi:MAG: hypothetical protein U0R71_15570 [Solirubrobacterales bacterium]
MPGNLSELAPMESAQMWAFLDQAKQIRLATRRNSRTPVFVSAHWFVCRDKAVYVPLDPEAPFLADSPALQQILGLEKGKRFSAVVDEGDELTNRRSVHFSGTAAPVTRAKLREDLLDRVLVKYFYVNHPHLEPYLNRGSIEARRWFKLVPEEIDAWDLRSLPQPQSVERLYL